MRSISFSAVLLLCAIISTEPITAQQPNLNSRPVFVPFQVDGDWGLMDTLGREVKLPGFYKSVAVHGDFTYYIIENKSGTSKYWMMDSHTGDKLNLGNLLTSDPVLKLGETRFYHFEKNKRSVLASPVTMESFQLDHLYRKIEAIHLYDLKGKNKRSYLLAYDENGIGYVLSVTDHFSRVTQVPPFKKIELIGGSVKKDYFIETFLVGFAVQKMERNKEAFLSKEKVTSPTSQTKHPSLEAYINGKPSPKIDQPATISPPSLVHYDWMDQEESDLDSSEIFDYLLADKGMSIVNDSALSKAFGEKVALKNNMPVSIAMGGGVISSMGGDQSVQLNDEFAIKRITKKVTKVVHRQDYYLVHQKEDHSYTELLSDNEALFSWAKHKGDRLLSIRLGKGEKRLNAFFDYNGIALPKNKLMIPRKYYQGETMMPYLFE